MLLSDSLTNTWADLKGKRTKLSPTPAEHRAELGTIPTSRSSFGLDIEPAVSMAESSSQNERSSNDQEKERTRSNGEDDDDDALRLRRETEVPRYIPQQGTGSSVLGGAGPQGSVISTTNTPLTGPGPAAATTSQADNHAATSNKQNGAGYFPPYASPNGVDRDASSRSQQYGQIYMAHDSRPDVPLSTAGLSTPSSGFGYSPGTLSPYQSGSGPAGSASAATVNGASPGTLLAHAVLSTKVQSSY
jgi:hypothetical protein